MAEHPPAHNPQSAQDSRNILRVAHKEFRVFFATPAAYLFIGAFLAVTLFIFFWVEKFFARNIADVRPLFDWLPLLLIFLVAALTMRAWSEERRAGTLESLLTAPVRPLDLVLGKFVAALALVALALVLTLPLPIMVSFLGRLDWGPVIGGYVATLFLAAAYIAIGLYMSARTDNPIVALILTALVCSAFYLIGSDTLTTLFGHQVGDFLADLGTGTRFQSISRGVLDLRDLYYYLSIVGVFLTLNLFSLERLRWAGNPSSRRHVVWGWAAALTILNFAAANFWLDQITWARFDITHGHIYSLSPATRHELAELREPLLIRGYFSAKTHPLLAPLVPQVKDLLEEYAAAAGGKARVEFVDPTADQAVAAEAASKYGVKPVPFQTASRYQSAVVSSYFDIVVAYGDQFQHLGFRDLIEAKARGENGVDVVLKNPEYAITRAIRKTVNAYRAGGNPFESLTHPVVFNGYLSPDNTLPDKLRQLHGDLSTLLADLGKQSGGKLKINFADPSSDHNLAVKLKKEYGFGPQITSLFDPQPFWFYMTLSSGNEAVQVPLPTSLDKASLKRALDAALQRLAPGFLKTVAIMKPQGYGAGMASYDKLLKALGDDVREENTDLKSGRVPEDADLLLVLAPQNLDDKQRFAIDQFLMRGGSVVLATSPFDVQVAQTLQAKQQQSGLEDWLAHYGIKVQDSMVLDPRAAALPIPEQRYIGGLPVREIHMLPYPYFPDLRGDSLNPDSPVTASLGQLTLNWVSPIAVDAKVNKSRKVVDLLHSSDQSWTSSGTNVLPDFHSYPGSGFGTTGARGPHLLAVALKGRFDSFYQGKKSPLVATTTTDKNGKKTPVKDEPAADAFGSVIEHSPESARLLVIGSNTFASDAALNLASQGLETLYTKPIAFLQNAIDWSLEDPGLLALRGRTQLARTLLPMPESTERFWEYACYALALGGLAVIWAWRRWIALADRRRYQRILAQI